ncbi:hypothetical protein BDQ17DRAFT_1259351, partial [Cyathus striatus]
AFSTGCQQINFMQHCMTSNTFRAKMALGSWSNGPLFPGFEHIASIFEPKGNDNPALTQSKVADPDVSSSGEEFDWGNTDESSNESD